MGVSFDKGKRTDMKSRCVPKGRVWGVAMVLVGLIMLFFCIYMWYAWSTLLVGGAGEGIGFVPKEAWRCARQFPVPKGLQEADVIMTPVCNENGASGYRTFWVKALKAENRDPNLVGLLDTRLRNARHWLLITIIPLCVSIVGIFILVHAGGEGETQ